MLTSLIRRFFKGLGAGKTEPNPALLDEANKLRIGGDQRAAIRAYRDYIKTDPYNVLALNDLAVCLADVGDTVEAGNIFELASSLDDRCIPAIVNNAKLLNDCGESDEAMPLLRRAKISEPQFAHTDAVYAGICMKKGDMDRALRFQLKAWLGSFDNGRLANCLMFWSAYSDISELQLAAEHRFWAGTLLPQPPAPEDAVVDEPSWRDGGRRIRIGYWSSDFRSHSVRLFFRPVLENHDTERFELFLYHDFPMSDVHTGLIRHESEHFHDVHDMSDPDLTAFIRSHRLDVLVELAGHTSHNRLYLLQQRMATAQVTAIGYPPTTGLTTVDAKLLDPHVLTPDNRRYYAETPLVMPSSFWCFDPLEDTPAPSEPPFAANGYITFGCIGNIAKINDRTVQAWVKILAAVPDGRLLIRCVTFNDPAVERATREMLTRGGIPMDRVDMRKPEGGAAFYASYSEVDIILDTFPFNGGTTTCFATYMGVAVVSIAGESLGSRMGLTIMTNLGAADLVVNDFDAYAERAIALAGEHDFLRRFRAEARDKYKQSSLGNGAMFTREFEEALVGLLKRKEGGQIDNSDCAIPYLPVGEIMRRAYTVIRHGQVEAAQRIVDHCLQGYPGAGSAHVLRSQILSINGEFSQSLDYLREHMGGLSGTDRVAAGIALVRLHMLLEQTEAATAAVAELVALEATDAFDCLQIRLYQACLAPRAPSAATLPAAPQRVRVVVPCNSPQQFDAQCAAIREILVIPQGWDVRYERCSEEERAPAYRAALHDTATDIVLILQKSVEIHHPFLLNEVALALAGHDIVGVLGAARWSRMDWREDKFELKAGGYLMPANEKAGLTELQLVGPGTAVCVSDMAILDGSFLAARAGALRDIDFDDAMEGGEMVMEEAWTHAASMAGKRLAVHRNLGVMIDQEMTLDASNRSEARMRCVDVMGFDSFDTPHDDNLAVSAPLPDEASAVAACCAYFDQAR